MFKFSVISILGISVLISGCATEGRSTLLGTGIGAGFGAGIGAIAGAGPHGKNRARNIFIGATAGSLLGAGTGLLVDESITKNQKEAFERGKKEGTKTTAAVVNDPNQPMLIPPRIETRYVEDQIRGNTFIPAHLEYQIMENARWQK